MNEEESMIGAASETSGVQDGNPLAPARSSVFPLRFHDLGDDALIELWDVGRAGRPGELVRSVAGLEARLRAEPGLAPAAFIFHSGRCGSTLLARLFAAAGGNRVFDEPGAFHDFREARWRRLEEAGSRRALQVLISAHGLGPGPGEARLVIKFDSRAVLAVPALRECFPRVPFIYLLRDPAEVVASIAAAPPGFLGAESRPAMAAMFGGVEGTPADYQVDAWYAWYVERNLRTALRYADCFSEVIDYASFADRFLTTVNRISGTQLTADDPRIKTVLDRHSKFPSRQFLVAPNTTRAGDAMRARVNRIAGAAYAEWRARAALGPAPVTR